MGRKVTAFSDLTGEEVPEDQLGRLVVKSHPDLDGQPVYLEALPDEVAGLDKLNLQVVTVEWQPPGEGEPNRWREPRTLVFTLISPFLWFAGYFLVGGFQGKSIALPEDAFDAAFPLLFFIIVLLFLKLFRSPPVRWIIVLLSIFFLTMTYRSAMSGFSYYVGGETFWLPRERLVFQGEDAFTGYVLKSNERNLVVLYDDPRIIVQKPMSALEERDFCYPEDHQAVRSSKVTKCP